MGELKGIEVVDVPVPEGTNVIIGHTHFIKSVEDIYEALVTSSTCIKFGFAFIEASGDRLIRSEGNDNELRKTAEDAAMRIGAGHTFIIYLKNAWPINVLNTLKNLQEVCRIYTATANPVQVIVATTNQGRSVLGVADGFTPLGVESDKDRVKRRDFLRKIGYKK